MAAKPSRLKVREVELCTELVSANPTQPTRPSYSALIKLIRHYEVSLGAYAPTDQTLQSLYNTELTYLVWTLEQLQQKATKPIASWEFNLATQLYEFFVPLVPIDPMTAYRRATRKNLQQGLQAFLRDYGADYLLLDRLLEMAAANPLASRILTATPWATLLVDRYGEGSDPIACLWRHKAHRADKQRLEMSRTTGRLIVSPELFLIAAVVRGRLLGPEDVDPSLWRHLLSVLCDPYIDGLFTT